MSDSSAKGSTLIKNYLHGHSLHPYLSFIMPVEYKGDTKAFNNVVFNLYVAPGCCDGCSGCCTNSLAIMLTGGSHLCGVAPKFTMTINEDGSGGKGVDNIICGCLPGSPIPCFNGCGFGPCAFVSPFEFVEVEGSGSAMARSARAAAARA